MKKSFAKVLIILFTVSIFFSCTKTLSKGKNIWYKYTYADYNGYLYVSEKNGMLKGIICADVSGIQGSIKIEHECTSEQFENLKIKLSEMGLEFIETVSRPNLKGYPDLSMYLTFVISYDELNDLWKTLGLESF